MNKQDIKIRLFDSFAGIGALHKALKNIGVEIELVGMSEIDVDAIISYSGVHKINNKIINFPTKEDMVKYLEDRNIGYDFKKGKNKAKSLRIDKLKKVYEASVLLKNYGDISIIDPNELPDFDLFNFSFPCTDISVSGKQKGFIDENGDKTRSGLYVDGIRVIKAKKPSYIMIENVKNLISKKFINDFEAIVDELKEIGYNTYVLINDKEKYKCLNAKNFGIPQNRERIFVIGIREDIDNKQMKFNEGKDYGYRLKDILQSQVDNKYYLSEEIQNRFKFSNKNNSNQNELNIIGSTAPDFRTIGQRDLTYGDNGVMSTLTATDYKQPKQILEMNRLGGVFDTDKSKHQAGSVWDKEGVSPTLDTMQGGYRQPCIITEGEIDKEGWMRRDRHVASSEGISPTLTVGGNTVQILENNLNQLEYIEKNKQGNRVYDTSYSPTISAIGSGLSGHSGFHAIEEGKVTIPIRQATKKGYDEATVGDSINLEQPNSKTRRGRVGHGVAQTLTCSCNQGTICERNYSIRKLTPLECWRLMGFTDADFYNAQNLGISDSQLYKQAGNSIVVQVLMSIFINLFDVEFDFEEYLHSFYNQMVD